MHARFVSQHGRVEKFIFEYCVLLSLFPNKTDFFRKPPRK